MEIFNSKNLIVLFLFITTVITAQQQDLSICVEGGLSEAGGFGFNLSGGGGSIGPWKGGYQVSIGVEYPLDKRFSLRGIMNYSWYPYDNYNKREFSHSNSKLTYFDLLADLKLNLGWFFLNGGIGLSSQSADEIRFWDKAGNEKYNYYSPQKNKFVISGILGLGLDINVSERFSLLLEGNIYMREYMGLAYLGGLKYRLE